MDILNCRLKRLKFQTLDGDHMYGFVLAARGETHQFYSFNKDDIEAWINALRPSVIILELQEEIVVKKLLGKGNTAKVHTCQRTNGSTRSFALKTICKSHIKHDANTVSLNRIAFKPFTSGA